MQLVDGRIKESVERTWGRPEKPIEILSRSDSNNGKPMGTDIHSIAQIKKGKHLWETVDGSIGGDERNYDTFAVLAGIRNGRGFAGCVTGEGWPVMSEPRGLPKDLETDEDDDTRVDGKWFGDHNHSWLTLAEMESFWENLKGKQNKTFGCISVDQFKKLMLNKEIPDSWSGGIGGGDVKLVDLSDQENLTELEIKRLTKGATHVRAGWLRPVEDSCWGLVKILKHLRSIAVDNSVSAEEVRFVFGFDS
jgi:hypothetical protein